MNLDSVQHDAEHLGMRVAQPRQRGLDVLLGCLAAGRDQDHAVNQLRKHDRIADRQGRRRIDDDVIEALAEVFQQVPHLRRGQQFARVGRGLPGGNQEEVVDGGGLDASPRAC